MESLPKNPVDQDGNTSSAWSLNSFCEELKRQFHRHILLVITSISFLVIATSIKIYQGYPLAIDIWPYFVILFKYVVPAALFLAIFGVPIKVVLMDRPARPIQTVMRSYSAIADVQRYAKTILVLTIMVFGLTGYKETKLFIGLINDYSWDITFMNWDRWLHFGHDPWRLLNGVFGSPAATYIFSILYNLWFVFLFLFWIAAGWTQSDRGWERQFLLSFLLCWLFGGFVLAILFASMGPAFYDLIDPANNPYEDQMRVLRNHDQVFPIWALGAQETLREAYLNSSRDGIAGISAMPSMHNATTALFVFAAFRIDKILGILMSVFMITIVIASVHLAWHYAIDAYVGILLAYLIWRLSIWLTDKQDKIFQKAST